jgi:putative resolvase
MLMMKYVKLSKAVELTGLHPNTLRKYANEGKIETIRTPYNQRMFNCESFLAIPTTSQIVLYCRVSSSKQRKDLDSQIASLVSLYPQAEVVKDIGSGLNYKRKGLKAILERASGGDKFTLVVAHKDRLARFGVELIEHMLAVNGCQLLVLNDDVRKSDPNFELTEDLLAIIHIFSCRLYGQRRYSNNQKQEDSSVPIDGAKEDIERLVRHLKTSLQPLD